MSRVPANDYAQIKRIVTEHHLLDAQPLYYVLKTVIALVSVASAIAVAVVASHPAILLLDAVFLGFASTQVALLAHDVGHRQSYRGRRTNTVARLFFGNLLLGVSHSWWNTKHNQHHATPNHISDDPDVQFPFLVFAKEQIESRSRLLRPLIAFQTVVFCMVVPLQAIGMRVNTVSHLLSGAARTPRLQWSVLALHFAAYGLLLYSLPSWQLALGFFAVHHVTFGIYNSSVFATNHKGMPLITEAGRLDFLREQVLTSRNVTGRALTDFWYGGLNYQIEHHLFPTMPRNNLARAKTLVEAFCEERGIANHETSLLVSYREVFRQLHAASAPLRSRQAVLSPTP